MRGFRAEWSLSTSYVVRPDLQLVGDVIVLDRGIDGAFQLDIQVDAGWD